MSESAFIDVDHAECSKYGQSICGDVCLTQRIKAEGRVLAVLSDGLGSGVKASVLANLTASMALKFASAGTDTRHWARSIMATLPICEVRKLSYSTFTLIDLDERGSLQFIEHGNPSLIVLREEREVELSRQLITLESWKERQIYHGSVQLRVGDRLICCSDGVSQSGMGRHDLPLGWSREGVVAWLRAQLRHQPELSSRRLSTALLERALDNDQGRAKDDISCLVVHYRVPRRLLVMTGPPFARQRDRELAQAAQEFQGRRIICGGTTATIVGRLLGRPITMELERGDGSVPPSARMEGVDLITEGALTLARVAQLLAEHRSGEPLPDNPAGAIVSLMLASDVIHFLVGTRINQAHQDPNTPQELDLRRNIVRRITSLLEEKYLNTTSVQYL